MAENEATTPKADVAATPPTTPAKLPPPVKQSSELAPAHTPLGEEFDKPKWTMPPWQPVVIALVLLGVIVAVIAFTTKAKPPASGGIDEVTAVNVPGDMVMVAANVHFANTSQKTIIVNSIKATLQTPKGEFSDDAANASDFARYYQAFPDLKQNAKTPLMQDARIAPGANGIGTVIVSFPITKEAFDARQSLTITVQPYDMPAIVLKK